MRLVLDTNVWLDWLVFGGKEVVGLRAAHHAGMATFVIDDPCLEELARVLAYPTFNLDAAAISSRLDEAGEVAVPFTGDPRELPALPRCRDPDDQKFLQLAAAARVTCLVTRDQALLRLGKRTACLYGFEIRKPGHWNPPTNQSRRLTDSDTAARAVR
jgi:putative PIN family toxin of toxin-antitoxin system